MRIVLSGASGLIGQMLKPHLLSAGHQVDTLVRRPVSGQAGEIHWNPEHGTIDAGQMEGIDAAVHLSGQNVAVRWTAKRKEEFERSRVDSTTLLCKSLARLQRKPRVIVSASAIGFYGDRGDEPLTEDSAPGTGFFPELCQKWEAATAPARDAGIRVVNLRIGIVLSRQGGALAKMLLPFKLGLGGRIGRGMQYMSWIWAQDLIRAIEHALKTESIEGPVNGVAPESVRQREFAKTLAHVLHRPAVLPMPATVVRLLFGEMGQTILLGGAKVLPGKLIASGFTFQKPSLEPALTTELSTNGEAR